MRLIREECRNRRPCGRGRAWILLIGLTGLLGRAAAASDWYVNAATGSDLINNCMSAATPCMTIQAAINKASASDTIHVAAGVYPEPTAPGPLGVNKTLILLGAQNGIDARGRVASESIVTDSQGTYITASNVVIDGFTFENSVNGAFTGYGILMGAGTTGTQLLNNIVQDNIIGIGLANTGVSPVLIRHNQIQDNNVPGPSQGDGIYTDQFVSQGAVQNVLIVENAFKGNIDAGIDVSNTDALHAVSNVDVSTNSFDQNGRAVLLFNTHTSTIHNNTITNCTLAGSAAIRLFENNSALSIMNNTLMTGVGHAIRLSDLLLVNPAGAPSSNVVINKNNIGTTGSTNFAGDGLLVDPGSHVGTVNAQCNWWGSSKGPTALSNPGGTGEEVVGDANFTPWWTTPSQTAACPSECERGDGDGDFEDNKDGHRHHESFHHASCEADGGRVEDDDRDSGKHFQSTSVSSGTFTSDTNSQTLTMVGTGIHDGLPVGFTMVAVDNRGLAPGVFTLILSDGYKITGSVLTGTIVIH
jgi:Right handed beta helix region